MAITSLGRWLEVYRNRSVQDNNSYPLKAADQLSLKTVSAVIDYIEVTAAQNLDRRKIIARLKVTHILANLRRRQLAQLFRAYANAIDRHIELAGTSWLSPPRVGTSGQDKHYCTINC